MAISSKDLAGSAGADFERLIETTFQFYDGRNLARLAMMPVPTRQVGSRNGQPILVRTGAAPFDVYGYLVADGRMVGAELKSTVRKVSLPIIGPERTGSGLQFHQLDALANLAQAGGIARLVWCNGGGIGVLADMDLVNIWSIFCDAITSERAGRKAQQNSKSIKWERFETVDKDLDWLVLDRL